MSDEEQGTDSPMARRYPSNSKSRGKPEPEQVEKPKLEPVVTGKVVQRKKPIMKRIVETFAGDDVENVGQFIIRDVVVPAVKNLISDVFSQGVERMLFGEVSRRSSSSRPSGRYTSYDRMSNGRSERRDISPRARASHDFRDVILDTRIEAEEVLEELDKLIAEYGVVSVHELYQLLNIPTNFIDKKWGWDDLSHADVKRVREGYMLILPRTQEID